MIAHSLDFDLDERREAIVDAAHRTYAAGFVAATDGNISIRDGETIWITRSGVALGDLGLDDIVGIDFQGRPRDPDAPKPSSEYRMHVAIYEARPDVPAIVHAHPPGAIALTLVGRTLEAPILPEVVVELGPIPTLPYTTPTTDETSEAVRAAIVDHNAILLAHHGAVCVGRDPVHAFYRMEKVEQFAMILGLADTLGQIRPLSPESVAKLEALRAKHG